MSGSQQVAEGDGAAAPPEQQAETEARAIRMGWQPREKYRGPPDKWVPAEEFIEKGERMLPLLQERNRTLDRTIQQMERRIEEQTGTLATLVQSTRRAEALGYQRARRELEEQRAKAVAEADTASFNEAERRIAELGPAPAAEPTPAPGRPPAPAANGGTPPQRNPVVDAWVARNTWFQASKPANGFAIGLLAQLEAEDPSVSIEENLAEVTRQAREVFPHLFPARRPRTPPPEETELEDEQPRNSRRAAPPVVTPSSSAPPRRPGPRSFDALPAEAKREWERQARMMEGKGEPFTKEEFARYYFENEEA